LNACVFVLLNTNKCRGRMDRQLLLGIMRCNQEEIYNDLRIICMYVGRYESLFEIRVPRLLVITTRVNTKQEEGGGGRQVDRMHLI
jgi:hypothetical protein